MKRILIKNAVIVNEGRKVPGSVVIEGEKIAEILVDGQEAAMPCDETIDASGCYLLPGAIDEHVHFRDPGLTHKADITTESHAAAAGGVTSIMDMPNTNPQTTTLEALNDKLALLAENHLSTSPVISERLTIIIRYSVSWTKPGMWSEVIYGFQYGKYAGRPDGKSAQHLWRYGFTDCSTL